MIDRSVLRWGGMAAMLGAVIGTVFNLLHPRSSEAVDSARAELDLIAGSEIWRFDHYMLGWSIALAFVGLVAIGWSFGHPRASGWARIATASAIGSAVIGLLTVAVDGMAADLAAQGVTDAGGEAAAVAGAENVMHVSLAFFTTLITSFFGLTPVLFGITVLSSDEHPRWLGLLALASGTLGLIVGSVQYLAGPSEILTNILFTIASMGFTIWSFVMGLRLWQGDYGDAAGVREPVAP